MGQIQSPLAATGGAVVDLNTAGLFGVDMSGSSVFDISSDFVPHFPFRPVASLRKVADQVITPTGTEIALVFSGDSSRTSQWSVTEWTVTENTFGDYAINLNLFIIPTANQPNDQTLYDIVMREKSAAGVVEKSFPMARYYPRNTTFSTGATRYITLQASYYGHLQAGKKYDFTMTVQSSVGDTATVIGNTVFERGTTLSIRRDV